MSAFNNYKAVVLADSPVAYYRMDESSGTTINDSSGNGNSGTTHNSPTLGSAGLLIDTPDTGDTCITFAGASSQYISLPTTFVPTGAHAWSLECWCKATTLPGSGSYACMMSMGSNATGNTAQIKVHNNAGTSKFNLSTFNGDIEGGPTVSNTSVYHVVGTYDGTSTRLYVNGSLVAGPSNFTLNLIANYADIGADGGGSGGALGDYFTGPIDEAAFYTVALSATQVSNHYNAGRAITKLLGVRTRLGVQVAKTLGVRARIVNLVTKTLQVRARIPGLSTRTLQVRARVANLVTKTLGVRVRIGSLLNGGVALWANGTGTASFDHFRATQYPDPALSLAPVLPRLGNTTVRWDETIPTNGSRTVKTSLDGMNWTDVSSQNGGTIPGLNGQPDPTIDYFNTNTSANYTNTAKSGGSTATVTYDTADSRVTLSGGSGGLYLYTAISDNDVDLIADMDESDAGGLVWRFVDTNNYYELGAYDDSSSGGFTNQLRLYKVVSGTRSLIGSASTIAWPRSTPGTSPYKRLRVTMLGTTITVYFDGTVMQTATDATFASGKMGLRNDGGTSRYYQLRLQPIGDYVSGSPTGDIVTGDFVYTQVTLSTTDPAVNPQIQDLATTANSPSVANGAVISQLHDPTKPFAAFYNNELDSLVQSSGDCYWALNSNALTFAKRQAVPAPWILHSSDLLFTPRVKPTFSADLYRNRQTITNCLGTVAVTGEQKIADGTATSWQMAYPLYSAPTITVNGVSKTIGTQGVDTGKDFYWQAASNSISQDTSATAIPQGDIISVTYVGQFTTNVTRDNLPEQAARQAVEGGTGIVEAIEDGKQMLVSAAQTYADGLLARFSNNNTVEIQVTTRRSGLQKGQALPTFLPEHGINNAQLLVTKIVTIGEQLADGTILYQWQVTATNGPNLNRWATALGL